MSKDILPDDLLKEALRKAQEMKTSAYDKEISQEEEHVFSKEYREKMDKLLAKFENEPEEEKKIHVVKKKNMKLKILLVAAIVMLMGSMTVMAVEPLREAFYQLVEQIFSDHTYVSFKEIEKQINANNMTIDRDSYPQKINNILEGYYLEYEEDLQEESGVYDYLQIFHNSDGKSILYEQISIEEIDIYSLIVSSDGTKAEEILVCGESAYVISDEVQRNTIIYPRNGFIYLISGQEDINKLVECLESVFM